MSVTVLYNFYWKVDLRLLLRRSFDCNLAVKFDIDSSSTRLPVRVVVKWSFTRLAEIASIIERPHSMSFLFLAKTEKLCCLVLDETVKRVPASTKLDKQKAQHQDASRTVAWKYLQAAKINWPRAANRFSLTGSWSVAKKSTATNWGNIVNNRKADIIGTRSLILPT